MKNNKQLNILEETHLQQIKGAFSDISWKRTRLITSGCDNDVLILDASLVFRFPKNQDALNKLKLEIQTLSTLGAIISLQIPQISFIGPDFSFICYPIVRGTPILPKLINAKLSSEQLLNFQKDIANFLKELHSGATNQALKRILPKITARKELAELKVNANKHLKGLLDNNDIKTIKEFFGAFNNAFANKSTKTIIHGDLSWEHLLFDRAKTLSGIIDFSDAMYGDPAIDFACLWDYGPVFVKTTCKLYDRKNYKELYLRSKLHYQKVAIILLIESQRGNVFHFNDAYKMFKKRFD